MLNHNGLVVVADGHGATLYRNVAQEGVELKQLSHLTPKNLADEAGGSQGLAEQSPHEAGEADFAKRLALALNAVVLKHKADEVVIIADPQTLGQMRHEYHPELEKRIVKEIAKTLTKADTDAIAAAVMKG